VVVVNNSATVLIFLRADCNLFALFFNLPQSILLTFGFHFKYLIMTYEEAKEKVLLEPYPYYDNTKWAKKVVPMTRKYFDAFEHDLIVEKYKLTDDDCKIYVEDNEFDTRDYRLSQLNLIFR
jgi:hypothetical protein